MVETAPIAAFAPAKLNLYLEVTGRRADGYHLLDSLVVFADIGDEVSVAPARDLTLEVDGPFAAGLAEEADNLVLRAARALAAAAGKPPHARITLLKRLPIASGIGGGSSDAAATLRALVKLWRIDLSAERLEDIALQLGADVPACLAARPLRMEGIGERLTPLPPLPPLAVLLVNPRRAVPTAAVFRHPALKYSEPGGMPIAEGDAPRFAAHLARRSNDLEAPACAIEPAVAAVLARLRRLDGALLARMSGSGGTCFALFENPGAAVRAEQEIAREHADWWVKSGRILAAGEVASQP